MKICKTCNKSKMLTEYHKSKNSKDGYKTECKTCRNKQQQQYRDNNKDKINEYMRNYYEKNKNDIKLKCKKWVENNRIKSNNTKLKWKEKNKEKWLIYTRTQNKTYTHRWRMFLHTTLKRMNKIKNDKTINILGYSPLQFKIHLESLFIDDMSWDNYGKWHIDHIIPLSKFDKNTPIHIVNALSNIQPLWAKTNLSKGNKL